MLPTFRTLRDLTAALAAVLLLCIWTTRCVAIPWAVSGESMEPALRAGDRVIVDLWTYRRRSPLANEVALLTGPTSGPPVVKRVASGPLPAGETPALGPYQPVDWDEEWFVVHGDNAARSFDSRQFGPVPRRAFLGRVVFRYWPPDSMGWID